LLASESFVEYWTFRFSKLLRMHSLPNEPEAMEAYAGWLRNQLRSGAGWDKMASQLIQASGDSHSNGAANFGRMVADARSQAELVGECFAGIQLGCANCHNHPLDRWTQQDYHGLAAVFAKVDRTRIVRWNSRGAVTNPKTGERIKGRISKINEKKPHLVLALHLNPASKGQVGGMAAVLTPGYKTFSTLKQISEKKKKQTAFTKGPWSEWLVFQSGWSKLENAMADAWIYFHGYWSTKDGSKSDLSKFEGYRQNMVTWRYADDRNWENKVGIVGPYAKQHEQFKAEGKFWEREKSKKEEYRREGGLEGFGGDNHYVSRELMRFVQYGLPLQLKQNEKEYPEIGPIQKPYISTYSLPTYTNALCAFIEIGYVNRSRDMKYLTEHKKETAIALAVGIYSLFVGLEVPKNPQLSNRPKGKPVKWERYQNYFEEVVE
ncbi:MAG: DUF1549 domain-containing protein, partial [Leptospira sp.]|nr:DUF1549 domain-containing protein [Leptospira sp.]